MRNIPVNRIVVQCRRELIVCCRVKQLSCFQQRLLVIIGGYRQLEIIMIICSLRGLFRIKSLLHLVLVSNWICDVDRVLLFVVAFRRQDILQVLTKFLSFNPTDLLDCICKKRTLGQADFHRTWTSLSISILGSHYIY